MKLVAKIIFFVFLFKLGFRLWDGIQIAEWQTIAPWLNWSAILLGYFGLGSYAFDRPLMPQWFWTLVFFYVLLVFSWQLMNGGLFVSGYDTFEKGIVFVQYLWETLPLLLPAYALSRMTVLPSNTKEV
ncbi:MAG: hypothetical protein AAF542_25565 [Pseudomonadota bacterium]